MQKQRKTATPETEQTIGLRSGGLMITRIFESEISGAHFQEGLFFELVIGIIWLRKSTQHVNDRLGSIYQIVHV